MKRFLGAMLLAALILSLCGCGSVPLLKEEPTDPPVETVAAVVTAEELAAFDTQYPALKSADLTGSTCYAEIEQYIAGHPGVQVTYSLDVGGTKLMPNAESVELGPEDFSFPDLRNCLQYLHSMKKVHLRNTCLLPSSIQELRQAYPGITFTYDVELCGVRCDGDASTLDLSGATPENVLSLGEIFQLFPNLTTIQLMDAEGKSAYSLADAAELQKLAPNVLLLYSFDLFEKQVSTTDEEVVYQSKSFGKKEGALDTLRQALTVMRGCKRLVLDNCQFNSDDLAAVRDEFRGRTDVVWRIWFGEGGCLTDRDVIRHVYGLYDYNSANLIYCRGAEYVDFGHNEILKNCDFISGMTNLKAVILSGSMISDLTPFANCQDLEFLEIAYCGYIDDISPLANCKNLKRLNIAFTKVTDLSPLDGLDLEVFVDACCPVSEEEDQRFDAAHPECLTQHTGDVKDNQPYGHPWRYETNGDPNPYYALLKEKFHYPNPTNTRY